MIPKIAISIGDMNGIGPEVILKALRDLQTSMEFTPVVLGSHRILEYYLQTLDFNIEWNNVSGSDQIIENQINVLECLNDISYSISPGKIQSDAGSAAMHAVETGIQLCTHGIVDALVTAPISKEAIQKAGYPYPGHTEFLADKTNTHDFVMMLVNDNLRVGLVTIHIPVSEISRQVTKSAILKKLGIINKSLLVDFGIDSPKIAVLGLNPHAGDGGVIGHEEIEIIRPAIEKANSSNIKADGPFPADGFFGNRLYKKYDAILSMYHDQGLVAFKALSFNAGVNFTAGLPIIRTSPDHGTAFSIAGKNQADHHSFIKALKLAVELSHKRQKAYYE